MSVAEIVDAKKVRFSGAEALNVVRQAEELWIAKGKNVRRVKLTKEPIEDDDLRKLILGPSGNLRAPAIRRGRRMFIGFEPTEFAKFVGE